MCQEFARDNRKTIAKSICYMYGLTVRDSFESAHNYIDESGMIRKGAISARASEDVIIPMNMRDGTILGIGKGNNDWNVSAPHGAGRIMGRKQAKRSLSMSEFTDTMSDVYSSCVVEETLDESPMAYKPMEEIVAAIGDTVTITKILKPIYNFKAIG